MCESPCKEAYGTGATLRLPLPLGSYYAAVHSRQSITPRLSNILFGRYVGAPTGLSLPLFYHTIACWMIYTELLKRGTSYCFTRYTHPRRSTRLRLPRLTCFCTACVARSVRMTRACVSRLSLPSLGSLPPGGFPTRAIDTPRVTATSRSRRTRRPSTC